MNSNLLKELVAFWFSKETEKLWFNSTSEFDKTLKDKYEALYLSELEKTGRNPPVQSPGGS